MNYQEKEIKARLKIIGTYFDLNSLLDEKTDNQAVAKYYRKSDFFYNLIPEGNTASTSDYPRMVFTIKKTF